MSHYKINIHAHSIFSDGCNTPYVMALKARELGFTALILTDHYYSIQDCHASLNSDRIGLRRLACHEAKAILPIILGFEICYAGQEILLFGGDALKYVDSKNGVLKEEDMLLMRNTMHCAMVLCHPGNNFEKAAEMCDGYEKINSAQNLFREGRDLSNLKGKPSWCNSDAHRDESLTWCWNEIDSKITNESDLIKYIKSGKQPVHHVTDPADLRS